MKPPVEPVNSCRIDVWLWRARFLRTRSLAAEFVERGAVRLTRHRRQARVEKPGRDVQPGDELLFALGGRLVSVRVLQTGERRGPPEEARALYETLEAPPPAVSSEA